MATVKLRRLGRRPYEPVWREMQRFTERRTPDTPDELWLVEHPPVYTLGLNGRRDHLFAPGAIPLVEVDRGGQVTYHGPGQLILYTLLDIRRLGLGVRALVSHLEGAVIELLAGYGFEAVARSDAPGVYVDGAKIAALGLRVKRGGSYHGLSLNLDLDLEPFTRIDPCGHPGMAVTRLADLGVKDDFDSVAHNLVSHLVRRLGYTAVSDEEGDHGN